MFVTLGATSMRGVPRKAPVCSFAEASATVRDYIEKHDLGAGCSDSSPAFTGGSILAADKKTVVGRVSYNGRVWGVDGQEILTCRKS